MGAGPGGWARYPAAVVRYLSDAWLEAAGAALDGFPPLTESLTVGFVVTGGPDGERSYRIELGPGPVAVRPGAGDAHVTLRQSWETARAVARGTRSAQRAFLDGDIRIDGDVRALLGHGGLGAVDDRLGELRDRTEF
jgi:hypothetical protein